MPQHKYHIKSREAQQVLGTPPRALVSWGNVIVVAVITGFAFFCGHYRVPFNTRTSCQLSDYRVAGTGTPAQLKIFIGGTFPQRLSLGDSTWIDLETQGPQQRLKVRATVIDIDTSHLQVSLSPLNNLLPSGIRIGARGTITLGGAPVTLLQLFGKKMLKINDHEK